MFEDPIVEKVRETRKRHSLKFDNDLEAIVADLQEKEKYLDRPVVSRTPKKPARRRPEQENRATVRETGPR